MDSQGREITSDRITITFTRYDEPDEMVVDLVQSLSRQRGICADVLFYDQQLGGKLAAQLASFSTRDLEFSRFEISPVGLSHARNAAIEHSRNDIILFIDCDAAADPDWARELASTLRRQRAGLVGGRILPSWERKPLWITRSRLVRDLYSILDRGIGESPANRIFGANFGVHRARLGDQAYFESELGRRPGTLLGGEETDLARRAAGCGKGVWYNGSALVRHKIRRDRIAYRWLVRRFYYQGVTRARVGGGLAVSGGLNAMDCLILPVAGPVYLAGYIAARLNARPARRS